MQRVVRIGHVDLGQQRARARLQRIGDARHRAGKVTAGHFRHADDGLDPRRDAEGLVLRHVELDADHVALHHGEHEGAAGGVGLDQAADIDVALRDDAIERRDHALIDLLLMQDLQLRFLLLDVGLRDRHRRLLRRRGSERSVSPCCGVAQPFWTSGLSRVPGDLREVAVGLRLLQRRPELRERALRPARSGGRARAR